MPNHASFFRTLRRISVVVPASVFLTVLVFVPVAGRDSPALSGLDRLEKQIRNAIRGAEGEVGVSLLHVETGRELAVNGDTRFPMASAFKVPVLVELLYQVKEGKFGLDEEIRVGKTDQHMGSGLLSDLIAPGIVLSLRNLVNMMMLISDNSAADMLLSMVGPANINARLKTLGIEGLSVDRPCQKLIMDYLGVDYAVYGHLPLDEIRTGGAWTAEQRKAAVLAFTADPQDQSTPRAMTTLLAKIFRREIIDPASCDMILGIMRNCQTGQARIPALLPPGTPVAHKTGTIAGTVNDCGIIDLPDGRGHVVLTVWTKNFLGETEAVEAIIAEIARFAYDYFYFVDGSSEPVNP
ncbi:MAG: serine hydrolase [Candidatus Aminicenantes bacterium]|nr:serine hydrolase [Candidatus Aminicenantes bacterium]